MSHNANQATEADRPAKRSLLYSWHTWIAFATIVLLIVHLILRWTIADQKYLGVSLVQWPLVMVLVAGGLPLMIEMAGDLWRGQFGSDMLAAVSIITSLLLGEYLAGAIVVLMLSGGQSLEDYAVRSASSVLDALASRLPTRVHRLTNGVDEDVPVSSVRPGDKLIVYPHEICPVDGTVSMGQGSMDESYLSGEPYLVAKSIGSQVLSGAINGASVLHIVAVREAKDSRYAKIMQVMQESAQHRPKLRRLGDQLGALYTPLALAIAGLAWLLSGDATRFLSVIVVATPCPLLIAIPVAVIGSISLAARRSIIIKNPAVLERLDLIQTALFDKTGTLTYGRPILTKIATLPEFEPDRILQLAATLERYSKHPLSVAVLAEAKKRGLEILKADDVSEEPGKGLRGHIGGQEVWVTSRKLARDGMQISDDGLPPRVPGMECIIVVDQRAAAVFQFRDQPRVEGEPFVTHLKPRHGIRRVVLISGDREEEVRYLAEKMGIKEVHASQSPEQKVEIVRRETSRGDTLYVGDGINDAPALTAATIGVAFGRGSEITSEAADAVVLDSSLERVDELLHIGRRMRSIALQSAVGGMALSIGGMLMACAGWLPPVAGALLQEGIDVLAVLNALRAAVAPRSLSDFTVPGNLLGKTVSPG